MLKWEESKTEDNGKMCHFRQHPTLYFCSQRKQEYYIDKKFSKRKIYACPILSSHGSVQSWWWQIQYQNVSNPKNFDTTRKGRSIMHWWIDGILFRSLMNNWNKMNTAGEVLIGASKFNLWFSLEPTQCECAYDYGQRGWRVEL